jgi:hypothetical protein
MNLAANAARTTLPAPLYSRFFSASLVLFADQMQHDVARLRVPAMLEQI